MQRKETERLAELDKAPVGRLLWKYSVPAVVGIMVMSIYNFIGRIFIGHGVGPDAIAGLAITFPVMNVSAAFGVLVGVGASARISIALGRGDHSLAERILGNSIVMTLVFGTFYVAMFGVFLDPILRLFGASDATLPYAHDYMIYILPGLLFNNLAFSYSNVMRSTGYPQRSMMAMFIGAGLNLVLAPLFIFDSCLGWGIKGAAIASDIAMGTSAAFVMYHFFRKSSLVRFRSGTYHLSWEVIQPVLAIGVAPCIVNTASCFINAFINNTVYDYGGDAGVAAIGIFTAVAQLIISFVIGVCQGMQPIVGYNFGAKRYDRLRRAFWLSVRVCTVATLMGTLIGFFIPRQVSMLFTGDTALLDASENALRLAFRMFWCVGFQIVVTTFFQSLGEAKKSIFMSLTRQVLFIIPLLYTLPHFFALDGVWLSYPISDFLATMVSVWLIIKQIRKITAMRLAQEQQAA